MTTREWSRVNKVLKVVRETMKESEPRYDGKGESAFSQQPFGEISLAGEAWRKLRNIVNQLKDDKADPNRIAHDAIDAIGWLTLMLVYMNTHDRWDGTRKEEKTV